jgi:hypothetical protein
MMHDAWCMLYDDDDADSDAADVDVVVDDDDDGEDIIIIIVRDLLKMACKKNTYYCSGGDTNGNPCF